MHVTVTSSFCCRFLLACLYLADSGKRHTCEPPLFVHWLYNADLLDMLAVLCTFVTIVGLSPRRAAAVSALAQLPPP
jgi:hypothetical protein